MQNNKLATKKPNSDQGATTKRVTQFSNRYRYFVLVLGWLCLTSISSNMIALNFTLICMTSSADSNIQSDLSINDINNTLIYTNNSLNSVI